MEKLSWLAETLIGSEIVKLGNAITTRINNGEKIYNYTIGDFDPKIFSIPIELENLIIESYQQKNTNYPAGDGVLELRKSVSAFIKEREGLDYSTSEIQIASGGRPLIYTVFKTFVDKGDKVIYAAPSWNNNHYAHLTDAIHCLIECTPENNFMPTAAQIAPHIKGATLLCLCTPQNPTGTTLSKDELEKICDLILEENKNRGEAEKKLYLMFDQMYWMLTYGKTQHYNPVSLRPEMKQYTVFVDGITKAFASTGVRVGWAMGPENIISKIRALLSHLGAWAPMAEQKAVAKYLLQKDAIDKYFIGFTSAIEERLHKIYEGFISLKSKGFNVDAIAPQAAIYLTVKVDLVGKKTAEGNLLATQSDVTDYILSEAKLAIVPFSAFGANKNNPWYRVSVGTCKLEDVSELFEKLEAALQKLN
ncbi:aspartate aminotransferase [mine drainage metagenome]|uniref:Aspartate aminotransferase n=1 Tax=mine drainage metagenome TaxID=410659 RepID=A0A1J5SGL6_9ZZZZ